MIEKLSDNERRHWVKNPLWRKALRIIDAQKEKLVEARRTEDYLRQGLDPKRVETARQDEIARRSGDKPHNAKMHFVKTIIATPETGGCPGCDGGCEQCRTESPNTVSSSVLNYNVATNQVEAAICSVLKASSKMVIHEYQTSDGSLRFSVEGDGEDVARAEFELRRVLREVKS